MSNYEQELTELAKYIYCATKAFELKLSFEECWKRFISPIPERKPDTVYIESARIILVDKLTRDAIEKI